MAWIIDSEGRLRSEDELKSEYEDARVKETGNFPSEITEEDWVDLLEHIGNLDGSDC